MKRVVTKSITYFILPIVIFFLMINIIVVQRVEDHSSVHFDTPSYYTSQFFYDEVGSELLDSIGYTFDQGSNYFTPSESALINDVKYDVVVNFPLAFEGFDFVYIDHGTNIIYSNRVDTHLKALDESLWDGKYYYRKFGDNTQSTIGMYDYFYNFDMENVDIYFSLDEINYTSKYYWNSLWYDGVLFLFDFALINIVISLIIAGVLFCLLIRSVGDTLKSVDKISLEIYLFIILALALFTYYLVSIFILQYLHFICIYMIVYFSIFLVFTTILRRIKSDTFINSTLLYKIFCKLKGLCHLLSEKYLYAIIIFIFIVLHIVMFAFGYSIYIFIFYIMYCLVVGAFFCRRHLMMREIKKIIESIYENKVYTIEEKNFSKSYYEIALKLDNISHGLEEALNAKLMSEKMKADLITNVSHDIKTPLTSIINYIDLLKQEKNDSAQITEYIRILNDKALRLKHLTDDLLELSKASSKDLKMEFCKVSVCELIHQLNGEYSDSFHEANLDVVFHSSNNLYIQADIVYIYRVFDNLYSNLTKYTMQNTRIYIDVSTADNQVMIEIKNISNQKLNVSKEELMQRFVRGDNARTGSGSGLGLSIIEHLVILQRGEFDIYIDGDLFKSTLVFKAYEGE